MHFHFSSGPARRQGPLLRIGVLPLIVLTLAALGLFSAAKADAQSSETIVHSFNDGTVPGAPRNPDSPLIVGTDGNFYGTTFDGGSSGEGTVFKFTTHLQLTPLHTFGDGSVANDGANPSGALVQGSDGNFYGTTQTGGSAGEGTIFKITPAGTVTILHDFGDASVANDGTGVGATIAKGNDGNFYGTTEQGGSTVSTDFYHLGYGIVFKITPSGAYTILHDFGDGSITNDGESPEGVLIQATDGNFYGTTARGGSPDDGTVFKITASGTETTLHSFGDGTVASDGIVPVAALLQGPDGNFYGTTEDGGSAGFGTAFKITPTGTETVLHSFQGSPHDGAYPEAPVILGADGSFYGTTIGGNTYGLGTLFRVSPNGGESVFYNFQDRPRDSTNPTTALVIGPDGNFWGTTDHGGIGNDGGHGVVYKITTAGAETALYLFSQGTAPNDGSTPEAGLVLGSNGTFYGTTEYGGLNAVQSEPPTGYGTVFAFSPSSPESVIYNFSGYSSQDGANPAASLVLDSSGDLYGTTTQGGSAGQGTVFKITPSATESVLHSFHDGSVANDGAYPEAALVLGTDGNYYGTTIENGASGEGTVFKITPSGTESVLHSFGNGTVQYDGSLPSASLVLGNDGDFYGTTQYGGSTGVQGNSVSGYGTVFKVTPTGTVTILHSFGDGSVASDGKSPSAALVLGTDGNFYGTTAQGGSAGQGTVFKITASGTVTILRSFSTDAYDGRDPEAALVLGNDGNFYGTTVFGGSTSTPGGTGASYDGLGTAFEITPAGTLTILHSFLGYPDDGSNPAAPLTVASPGVFYGTTPTGGLNDAGTVYQIALPGSAPKPIITGFSPASGAVGTAVVVTGMSLTGTTIVGFMGKHATSFTVNAAGTQITTTVPAGAQTGPIAVLTNGVEAKSTMNFTVTAPPPAPVITGFAPGSGSVGTTVVITGMNLTGTTVVGFMGKHATSFTVNAAGTQITTAVPQGAQTGPIAVLTNGVEAKSSMSFTVTP